MATAAKGKGKGKTGADPSIFYDPQPYSEAVDINDYLTPIKLKDTSGYGKSISQILSQPLPQIPFARINKTAAGMAGYDIAQSINAYHVEQDRLRRAGAQQAALINAAAGAAAKAEQPYAQNILNAYKGAAGDLNTFTAGATGDMLAAAQADNARIQAGLNAIGSPQTPGMTQPNALANVASAIGGVLPSRTFTQQGLSAYGAAQAMPAAFRGYGLQQGLGVIGAAGQEADKYNLDINKVVATRGKLTSDYAATLTTQAQAQQKFLMEARAQQLSAVKTLASIDDQSNRTQLAVRTAQIQVYKAAQSAVDTHNKIVTATNQRNIQVFKALEQQHHNQITEHQTNVRIQQADDRLRATIDIANQAHDDRVASQNIAITNAQTASENSKGFWYYTDAKGHPYGLPQPTENHKIVWDGVPGKSTFHSVLIHAPGRGSGAANRKAIGTAIKTVQNLMTGAGTDKQNLLRGSSSSTWINPRTKKTEMTGFDSTLNNGAGGYVDQAGNPQPSGEFFYSQGGRQPEGYNDILRISQNMTGRRISIAKIKSIVDPYFLNPVAAAAGNLTWAESQAGGQYNVPFTPTAAKGSKKSGSRIPGLPGIPGIDTSTFPPGVNVNLPGGFGLGWGIPTGPGVNLPNPVGAAGSTYNWITGGGLSNLLGGGTAAPPNWNPYAAVTGKGVGTQYKPPWATSP